METMVRAKCPYCGFKNSYTLETGKHVMHCDIIEGGCDGMFVLDVRLLVKCEVFRVEGQGQGQKPKAELNGNYYDPSFISLKDMGATYLGEGEWVLPEGAKMEAQGGDAWLFTLKDGREFHVWTKD